MFWLTIIRYILWSLPGESWALLSCADKAEPVMKTTWRTWALLRESIPVPGHLAHWVQLWLIVQLTSCSNCSPTWNYYYLLFIFLLFFFPSGIFFMFFKGPGRAGTERERAKGVWEETDTEFNIILQICIYSIIKHHEAAQNITYYLLWLYLS